MVKSREASKRQRVLYEAGAWLQPPSARDALEIAIMDLEEKFKNAPVFQWNGLIEKAIESDLKEMQRELAIMMEYRRYVIISSDEDHKLHQPEIALDGVSCALPL